LFVPQKIFQPIPDELLGQRRDGGFIRYFKRPSGLFGSYYSSHHSDHSKESRKEEYLGKVIDKSSNIFFNNKFGFFSFTQSNGYISLNDRYTVNYVHDSSNFINLRFGDVWLLNSIYDLTNFETVLKNISPYDSDSLHALLAYKLSTGDNAFVHADTWLQRSYARILYPNAALSSGSISLFFKKFGNRMIREHFFDLYHDFLKEDKFSDVLICNSVLIDSTGAQNDINILLTATSNHNGIINNKFRVIYVVDHERNLPIYMDEVPGNIVDVSTLKYIVSVLSARNIMIKCCVLDAGYYSEENLKYLDSLKISYLVRMSNTRKKYKLLIENDSLDLEINYTYRILYKKRFLHCKKIIIKDEDVTHYAYIILDFEKQQNDRQNIYSKATSNDDIKEKYIYFGKFILYSNLNIDESEVLNLYYTREQIEQVFDISKNNGSMLPLRCHSTDTSMGHLLLSFISTIITLQLNNLLKDTKYCAKSALRIMSMVNATISNENSIVDPLTVAEKEIATILNLNLEYPLNIDLSKTYNNKYLRSLAQLRKKGRPKGRKNKSLSYTGSPLVEANETRTDTVPDDVSLNTVTKPGRPKGSKNKLSTDKTIKAIDRLTDKRRPGRPKGSKNKLSTDKTFNTSN
jgi:hypothetical protein